ncbi:MAG: hypothetical protein QXI58_08600 [Candidatus Micrarchaeia archaeon]
MDNFSRYSEREIEIIYYWLKKKNMLDLVESVNRDNTPFHDAVVIFKDGLEVIIEVKEEENYWFNKTGNLGLDFISAFKFKNESWEKKVKNEMRFWIEPEFLEDFLSNIEILKYGKLVTCDADIHIFYVENDGSVTFCEAYNNWGLQGDIEYFKKNFRLRVNDKKRYGLPDNWESAAYFVKPENIEKHKIISYEHLIRAVKRRKLRSDLK